jgi:hypothetical protein
MTIQEKFKHANHLLDETRYEEAIKVFREAIQEEPKSNMLANLTIALSLWHLQFLEKLIELHPEDVTVHAFRIRARIHDRRFEEAFQICTDVLNSYSIKSGMILQLKSLRLRCATHSGRGDYLKDDFISVWKSLKTPKSKRMLLRDLLSTSEANFAPVFLELAAENLFSKNIIELFEKKAQFLLLLDNIGNADLT